MCSYVLSIIMAAKISCIGPTLHELTGTGAFVWTKRHTKSFNEMKAILAADAMNTYPDLNLPFDVYTDSSDYQLGAAILQNGRPVAYWSKKLTSAQMNYTTMEKELLAIVMCLKEYRNMFLDSHINVHTDHKNLTFPTLPAQQVLRWKWYLEEYVINLTHIERKSNV